MLKRFSVSNYRGFKGTIALDFSKVGGYQYNQDCISCGLISKMLIYGRNATGKTNLMSALVDIIPMPFADEDDPSFINADSEVKFASFLYEFQFGLNSILYEYDKFSDFSYRMESCTLNGQRVFSCNYETRHYSFDGLGLVGAETAVVERFLKSLDERETGSPKLSFLRWIFANVPLADDSQLIKVDNYIQGMNGSTNISVIGYRQKRMYQRFFELLSDDTELSKFEAFMNTMGVEGSYKTKKLPDGTWELYFKHKHLVPFYENASSGTIALMNLYRRFVSKKEATLIFLDEFDAFYHYEMSSKLVEFFRAEYPNCQIIFTTHNTNLMTNRLVRPDCVFILSRDGRLTALCDATERELREGHNLEKMYISGEFERYE